MLLLLLLLLLLFGLSFLLFIVVFQFFQQLLALVLVIHYLAVSEPPSINCSSLYLTSRSYSSYRRKILLPIKPERRHDAPQLFPTWSLALYSSVLSELCEGILGV